MKTHTYFFSGKALAIVAGALSATGVLVFVVGVFVGLTLQAPAAQRAAGTALMAALPASAGSLAALANGLTAESAQPTAASPDAEVPAAWPFSAPPAATAADAPAGTDAAPADTAAAPAKPKADSTTRRRAVTDVAYVVPDTEPVRIAPARDTARYTVRVGAFRVGYNAATLVERLKAKGYRPVETVRDEGGRPLHIVNVGGYVGRRAAIFAAERIGNAENLVANAVPAREAR